MVYVGDCRNDIAVTVSEILTMVNFALGNAPLRDCEAADANHDGQGSSSRCSRRSTTR